MGGSSGRRLCITGCRRRAPRSWLEGYAGFQAIVAACTNCKGPVTVVDVAAIPCSKSEGGAPLGSRGCLATKTLSGSSATHKLQRVAEKLGLRKVTWHALRHTYVSRLCMLGVPVPTVQKLARHASIQMTLRYAHLCPNHERDSVELLAEKYPESPSTRPDTKPETV